MRNAILATVLSTFIGVAAAEKAQGALILGTAPGNDKKADVVAVIATYNATNATTLSTNLTLFKKTDDNAGFVFNATNGFKFYDAQVGGMQITAENGLTGETAAWFEYSGPAPLAYYSVKAANTFSVYTFATGARNLLEGPFDAAKSKYHDISHASFWTAPGTAAVPEPASLSAAAIAGSIGLMRRRRALASR
jgi:hypothetical protein